ncbi:MAG: hypothetical protein K5663_12150 [Clostridiales bacterium]|nr:hypothetical protein [Clostridiales bacterium]
MRDAVLDQIVSLSLDVGEFTRYMRAINASIKEEESSFKLAGAGVSRLESSPGGRGLPAEHMLSFISLLFRIISSKPTVWIKNPQSGYLPGLGMHGAAKCLRPWA